MLAGSGDAAASAPGKPPTGTPPNGVEVIARHGIVVETYKTAHCSIRNGVFTATATVYHSKLLVRVKPFSGFKRYELKAGTETGPYVPSFVEFFGGRDFASNFAPPYEVAQGGAVDFSAGGQQVGVGFMPVFDSTGSTEVIIDGVMACSYAKRGK